LAAEFAKLRRQVVFRAVVLSLLIGPGVMILVLRLVSSDISDIVVSPMEVVLGSVVILAAFGSVVLASAILGREFDWGTARAQLLRGVSRFDLLLAKLITALLSTTAAALLAALVGVAEAWLAGLEPDASQAAQVVTRTLALVPLGSLAYVGVTLLGAILGRSSAAGMLAGLVLFLGDFLLSTLRTRIPLGEWLPVTNLLALLGGTFTVILPSGTVLPESLAVGRLLLFGAATVVAALLVFQRRDVHQ